MINGSAGPDEPKGSAIGQPRRVLVVSADMGGGHNATAAGLEESIQRLWPGSDIKRVDALDVMGPGIGRGFRGIYVANVQTTPWLYELFYAALWRQRWFAAASKRFTGSWCGRRLAAEIDTFDPDLILSTYPLGSSGLAWLRIHRGLRVPTGCWVSDFAPHPFWIYSELDVNFVMDEVAVSLARAAEPLARVEVCAPPVVSGFRPGDRDAARRTLSVVPDAFVVLVSCGSYAFGDVPGIVRTLVEASDRVQVIAACGRNEQVFNQLAALGFGADQLLPMGWTDKMPTVVQAADLVLTNAGGATALEALASEVPLLTACPIAAHGDANAALMVVAGLTELCAGLAELKAYVEATAAHPESLEPIRARMHDHLTERGRDEALTVLASSGPASPGSAGEQPRAWPMRAADAFFSHVEDDQARQEAGVVLELDPLPDGQPLNLATLRRVVQGRIQGLASLRRVLVPSKAGWLLRDSVDVARRISARQIDVDTDAGPDGTWAAVGDFLSTPLPDNEPAWQMQLLHPRHRSTGERRGRSLLVMKMHHSLGDGISALGILDRLLDAGDDDPLVERRTFPDRHRAGRTTASPVRASLRLLRGLAGLALRGTAPRHPLNQPELSAGRDFVGVGLPWSEVRRMASEQGTHPQELVLGLVADALQRMLPAGSAAADRPLRAMVPVAIRAARLDRTFGNWTGSLALDLPMGEMPLSSRVQLIRDEAQSRTGHGEPQAAAAVMRLAGWLPTALHRRFARVAYTRTFFNTIVSYMPGSRRQRWCAGAPVRAMYPVLPLTRGVPLTIGIVVADGVVGVGVLLDRLLELDHETVRQAVRDAFVDGGGTPSPDGLIDAPAGAAAMAVEGS